MFKQTTTILKNKLHARLKQNELVYTTRAKHTMWIILSVCERSRFSKPVFSKSISTTALSYTRDDHCLLDTITKSLFVCVYRINCGNLIRWLSFEKTMRSWYKVDLLSTVCIGNFYFPKSWLFDCYSCDCNKPVSCKQLLCVDSFFRVYLQK